MGRRIQGYVRGSVDEVRDQVTPSQHVHAPGTKYRIYGYVQLPLSQIVHPLYAKFPLKRLKSGRDTFVQILAS